MAAKKRIIIISAAVAVVLSLCIGITMAYLGSFREKTNELNIGKDTVEIKEDDFSSPEVLKSSNNETEKTVTVENTGTVDCFVRVYAEFSDSYVGDKAMVKNTNGTKNDYMFWKEFKKYLEADSNNISPDWQFIPETSTTEDGKLKGYFYYKKAVKPGEQTSALFTDFSVSFTPNYGVYFNKPDGWGDNINAYIYKGEGESAEKPLGNWPGTPMSPDSSSGLYFLPFASTNGDYKIIFTDNNGHQMPAQNETGFTYQNLGIYTTAGILPSPAAGTERIYFKKPSDWENAYAYIYDTQSNDEPFGPWNDDAHGRLMNQIQGTDIYWVEYSGTGQSSWRVMFNNGKNYQEKLQLPPENESGYVYRNLGFYTSNGLFKMEDPNLDKITDYDIIVYSETVQTTEINSDATSKVYTDAEWKDAWKSFLKVTPANP